MGGLIASRFKKLFTNDYYISVDSEYFWNKWPRPLAKCMRRLYWKVQRPLSEYGCGKVYGSKLLSIYVVEKGAKAHTNIYVGTTIRFRGKPIITPRKYTVRGPKVWDHAAYLSKKGPGMSFFIFKGMRIEDENGQYLATAIRDLHGKSVRWSPEDFVQDDSQRIDFKDPAQAARLTKALHRMQGITGKYSSNSDWVV